MVTVNTNYKEFELEYLLKQSDTKMLVMIDGVKNNSYIDTIDKLIPEFRNSKNGDVDNEKFPFLKKIVYCGDKNSTPRGFMNFEDIAKAGESVTDEQLNEIMNSLNCHDVINMQYTSGTTGFPKGVFTVTKIAPIFADANKISYHLGTLVAHIATLSSFLIPRLRSPFATALHLSFNSDQDF